MSVFSDFLDQLVAMQNERARKAKHDRMWAGISPEEEIAIRSKYDPSVVSEAQGYQQLDDAKAKAIKDPAFTLQAASPEELFAKGLNPHGEYNHAQPFGAPVAGQNAMTAKAQVGSVAPDYLSNADIRNYRDMYARKPVISEQKNPIIEPLDLLSDQSINRDDDVQQTGWLPADFKGMSPQAAAALIADQLRTRRIRQMGVAAPDYLERQPIF